VGIVLRVIEGTGVGSEHAVEGDATIGREAGSADLVLEDEGVSRTHARVSAADAAPTVEDLGSSNGTYVNGERIDAVIELADGDAIQVGGTVLEVTGADSATQVMGAGAPPTAEHPGPARAPAAPPPQPDPAPRGPAPVPRRLAPHPQEEGNLPALAAVFLGPLSIFLLVFSTGAAFFVSLPCAIAAIVLASIGKRKVDKGETDSHRGLAVLGQVTGIIGVVLSTVALIAFLLIAALLDTAVDSLDGIVDELRDEIESQADDAPEIEIPEQQ
jgi:pSer/pThr/pTyr-binding forkhead associated (FHA) protein